MTDLAPSSFRVVDVDTVEWSDLTYRLIGNDTPETHFAECDYERALGNQAADRLRQILDSGQPIRMDIQPKLEKYRRGLASIYVGGVDVGSTLVSEGLARPKGDREVVE